MIRTLLGVRRHAQPLRERSSVLTVLACAFGRRGTGSAVLALLLGGVVGATVPTAVGAAADGAGLALGACAGLAGALWSGVLALPLLVAVVADPAAPDQRALHLAGWSRTQRTTRGLAAAGLLALGALIAAAILGALVGGADSVRHGQPPWSSGRRPTLGAGDVLAHAPIWLVLSTIALAAALVSADVAARGIALAVIGVSMAFVTLLPVLYPSSWRDALSYSPLGPAWSLTYRGGSARLLLPMTDAQRLTTVGIWICLAVLLVVAVRRRRRWG